MKALFVGGDLHGTAAETDPEVVKVTCLNVTYLKHSHTQIGQTFFMVFVEDAPADRVIADRIAAVKELFISNPVLHTDLSNFTFHTSED